MPLPALVLALTALAGPSPELRLYPSVDAGGGYDSNILPQTTRSIRGFFNQISPRFDLDLKIVPELAFLADYEIQYINYSGGTFNSLDNFLHSGFSSKPFKYLTLNLLGQWENFDSFVLPEFSFTRLSALPSLETHWNNLLVRGGVYYSLIEFPHRAIVTPISSELQTDRDVESLIMVGYMLPDSTVVSVTYSYDVISSNVIDTDTHHILNSYENGVALNAWLLPWRRSRLHLRLEATSRIFTDNSPGAGTRGDMGYKSILAFRQTVTDHLEGFVTFSYLVQNSNYPSMAFTKTYGILGIRVHFDPVRVDRWRKE